MRVRKEHLRGVSKNMLRVRLRIKGIKRSSAIEPGLSEKTHNVEPVENMVQRLRLDYS
jgi:hypothetical protein